MAFKIIRIRTNEEQGGSEITALMDSVADLEDVGTNWAPGSFAVVADAGMPTYILNASGEWKLT
jgi:hypothetical protein